MCPLNSCPALAGAPRGDGTFFEMISARFLLQSADSINGSSCLPLSRERLPEVHPFYCIILGLVSLSVRHIPSSLQISICHLPV